VLFDNGTPVTDATKLEQNRSTLTIVSVCYATSSSGKRKVSPPDFQKRLMFMSDALVKLQRKGQMVIPRSLREEVGISEGTLMKVAVIEGGQFLITPQITISRSVITGKKESNKQTFRELADVVAEIRQEAKQKNIDTIPMREINRAVAAARRDLKKANKRPAK